MNIFGKPHTVIGESTSDLILKCRGSVKILWGNKFIDLIKNGKINTESKFIYQTDEIGTKDGIYVIKDSVYLKIGNSTISIALGNTFISFLEGQETDAISKYNALTNIGFIYKSLEDINENSLLNGVIYVESELKLYIVQNGQLSEFTIQIPNPFINLFVIQKNDNSQGALVIKGSGTENSVFFDSFQIYSEFNDCILNADNRTVVRINNSDKILIDDKQVKVDSRLITNSILSERATSQSGFRLYLIDGKSILEIDEVRERSSEFVELEPTTYPEYWFANTNTIKSVLMGDEDTITITLVEENSTYNVGDILGIYIWDEVEFIKVPLEVITIDGIDIQVKYTISLSEEIIDKFVGKPIFTIKSDKFPIRLKENNIDIVDNDTIKTRIGNLKGNVHGIYSDVAYFNSAKLLGDIPNDANSIVTTTWVLNLISKLIPSGTIIAFHGETIPEGWVLCDGENNTPNLIDKFIIGGLAEMESLYVYEVGTSHTLNGYTLIFIMKT